jgi:hypothetical protein
MLRRIFGVSAAEAGWQQQHIVESYAVTEQLILHVQLPA